MKKRPALAVVLLLSAMTAFGALSKQYADFPKGVAQYLMTREEQKQWAAIATDEQARQFIDLFWARRDPTPGTPVNEFLDGVNARARTADERFDQGKTRGSLTDRGKVFIALGSPTKIRRSGTPGQSTIQGPTSGMRAPVEQTAQPTNSPKEVWQYEQGKVPMQLGQPLVEIAFIDQYGANEWKIERVPRTDYLGVFDRVAGSYIAQPTLTEVPVFAAVAPAAVALTGNAVASFQSDALRAAVEEARAKKAASDVIYLSYGEFITPSGEHFVPIQLYVPSSAGIAAASPVTFFGAIDQEADGGRVVVFEEPVTLVASNDAVYYSRSLTNLAPGRYVGTFGLARDGKPLSVVSQPIVVQGLEKGVPAVSPLMLSTNIHPLTAAQEATEPYSFGGLRVVPKGDLTFRRKDELWFFVEARNPGVGETGQPSLTMRIAITGTTAEGKAVKILGPVEPAPANPLKGVPGHFGIGQAMPLATLKPGSYTLALQLTDATLGKKYEVRESFRIVE